MNRYYKTRNCPNPLCNKELSYCAKTAYLRAKKINSLCLQCKCSSHEHRKKLSESNGSKQIGEKNPFFGKRHSNETKQLISNSMKGNIPWMKGKKHSEESKEKNRQSQLGKKHSEEHKRKIGLKSKGNKNNLGKTLSKEIRQKMSDVRIGRKSYIRTEESKRKLRISILKRFERLGISRKEDEGAKEYFQWLNMFYGYNFQPKRFIEIGYDADGYDEKLHEWIEYDTLYHKRIGQQKKDLIRQNNIIKYFESIGKPLNAFKRIIVWENNKLIKVYPAQV